MAEHVEAGSRCSVREILLGEYSPVDQTVTLPYDKKAVDSDPAIVHIHELTHRDLTQKTTCGILDIILAQASQDPEVGEKTRAEIMRSFERFFQGAFITHEGVAVYASLFFSNDAAGQIARLPQAYQRAVDVVFSFLPPLDGVPKPSPYLHGRIAVGAARCALDRLGIEDFEKASPGNWSEFDAVLLRQTTDDCFRQILANLRHAPGLARLEAEGLEFFGARSADELKTRIGQLSKDRSDFEQRLNAFEKYVYECSGMAWPYRPVEQKNEFVHRLFAFCKDRIVDEQGRPVFASFTAKKKVETEPVRVMSIIPEQIMRRFWRGEPEAAHVSVGDAVAWLFKFDAGRRRWPIVLQCRLSDQTEHTASEDPPSEEYLRKAHKGVTLVMEPTPAMPATDELVAALAELGGPIVITGLKETSDCQNFIGDRKLPAIWHGDFGWALAAANGSIIPLLEKSATIFYVYPVDTADLEGFLEPIFESAVVEGWVAESSVPELGCALFFRQNQKNICWAYPMQMSFAKVLFPRLKARFGDSFRFDPGLITPTYYRGISVGIDYFFNLVVHDAAAAGG